MRGSPAWPRPELPVMVMAWGPGRSKVGERGGDRIFTGLCPQMWEGATVPFPPEALRGTDSDSGPEDLVYTIEQPSNGWVVLRAEPGTEVHSFTQAQLDRGLVLFSHRGGYSEMGWPEDGEPPWARKTQLRPHPQEPWTAASASASPTVSMFPPDTSSA